MTPTHSAGPRSPELVRSTAAFLAISVLCTSALEAGQGVVTVNQHDFEPPTTACTATHSCNPTEDPPFAQISNGTNLVDAFSYHVNAGSTAASALSGRFCRATCQFDYGNRPKIISTDRGYANLTPLETWIDFICDEWANSGLRGRIHFEHWDRELTDAGVEGKCIGGYSTWPDPSQDRADRFQNRTAGCIPPLMQNGRIQRGNDSGGALDKLFWRNHRTQPLASVNLLGFGFMGAVAMGERLDQEAFLNSAHQYRANFFRIWAVEQWTGGRSADPTSCGAVVQHEGPNPFLGSLAGTFDLEQPNPPYYSTLRSLVQHAADRGIVLQLSVFDKHGLIDFNGPTCSCWPKSQWGRFGESPYNSENNTTGPSSFPYIESGWATCNCDPCPDPAGELVEPDIFEIGAECVPPDDFIQLPEVTAHNDDLIRRLAREVGGIGNVMFEVVNEAIAGGDWPGLNSGWQVAAAQKIKYQLPTRVARDAFNGTASAALAGRTPDWRSGALDVWTTTNNNVRVKGTTAPSGHILGYATSNGQAGVGEVFASLPISSSNWTEASIRAKLDSSTGGDTVQLGFEDAAGNRTYLQYGSSQANFAPEAFCPCVTLWHDAAGPTPPVQHQYVEWSSLWGKHFRLTLRKPAGTGNGTASITIDSEALDSEPPAVSMPILNVAKAYFRATGQTPMPVDGVKVDNFEAALYCDSPATCSATQ